jgi:hypothetical protein
MQFFLSFGHFGHFTDYKAGLRYCACVIKSGRQLVRYPIFTLLATHTRIPPELSMHSRLGLRTDGGTHGGVADARPQSARNVTAELKQTYGR